MDMQIIPYDGSSQAKRKKAASISNAQWQSHRSTIIQLHNMGYSVRDIIGELRKHHDFEPTPRQLWTRMNMWGMNRYKSGTVPSGDGNVADNKGKDSPSNFVAESGWCPCTTLAANWALEPPQETRPLDWEIPSFGFKVFALSDYCHSSSSSMWQLQEMRTRTCYGVYDHSAVHRRLNQVIDLGVSNLKPLSLSSFCAERLSCAPDNLFPCHPIQSWLYRYGRLMNILQEWLSSTVAFDIVVLSWMYLFAYELAFTTGLVARVQDYRSIVATAESRIHLRAAASFLDLMKVMPVPNPDELSWFIQVYNDFDRRLCIESLSLSADAGAGVWEKGLILVRDSKVPRKITTRSSTYLIIREDDGPEHISAS